MVTANKSAIIKKESKMRTLTLLMLILFLTSYCANSEQNRIESNNNSTNSNGANYESPDLVIGIIVDQMRPDYISRYWDKYGDGGIKRLVNEGFSFRNNYFRYLQTSTGPGHAAQLTGATPSIHGLLGNSWYVRELDRSMNVIEVVDSGYEGVGSEPDYDGERGPSNMLTTTVGDELYLHTNERSKTIGVSRKNRGAILPAGHTGDAYWYESATGNFITTSYYMDELPQWVREFNNRNLPQEYMTRTWEPLLPIEEYIESMEDENPYEGTVSGQNTFPIDIARLTEEEGEGPGIISSTPFGDELLIELAKAAIEGEQLGQRDVPDILSVSLSAADRLGHRFGPASKQVQDYYLRLDQYLEDFLNYIDEELGKENVLIFLTSDHGAVHVPSYLRDLGIPSGHPDRETSVRGTINDQIREYMEQNYGQDFLLAHSNQNLFLDHDFINEQNLNHTEVQQDIKRFVLTLDGVGGAITAHALNNAEFTRGIRARAQQMFHQKRSGDVIVWLQPHTRGGTGDTGTGHGSPWTYDTHAPLIFYGYEVPAGESHARTYVSDIASTISSFLNSPFPSGNIGDPLNDYMRE